VRLLQAERVRVPVDGGDAQPQFLRALDRAALMAACADEEHRPFHERGLYCGAIAEPTRRRACWPASATGLAALHRRYSCRVALEGKRIFVTGGAGFIGTTLARELVDRNRVVAYDNLHRDALSG